MRRLPHGGGIVLGLLIVAPFWLMVGCGVANWTQRDCYVNGPCVVKATQLDVQKHCFTPGMEDDRGIRIDSAAGIEACFDRETNTAWIPWSHLTDIYHEMCHYFCGLKETPTCDRDCDLHDEDGLYRGNL